MKSEKMNKKMRYLLVLVSILCGLNLNAWTQGISFKKENWKEILDLAKKENKLIFVNFYTDNWQPCREMAEKIFSAPKVADYFNRHFVNVKVDVARADGPILLNAYKVNAYPTLLFINGDGAEVFRAIGSKNGTELLKMAADALASEAVTPLNEKAQRQLNMLGKEIPDFCYEDIEGRKVKFSSLRGKFVYIDMWATWCRPCCEEIPHMKELEKQFHGENICFVSLSCDKNKEAWKKKVLNDELEGVQLNCGDDPEFMQFFGIAGLPHFILLDPEGRVINPNMSRPSQEITMKTLKGLKGI